MSNERTSLCLSAGMVLRSLQSLQKLGSRFAKKTALEVTEAAAGRIKELLSLRNKVRVTSCISKASPTISLPD